MSQLQDYGWLFTKDEVPFWGEVDWSPRWIRIQPRPLHELTPFRKAPSVDDWLSDGLSGAPRSAADALEAQIEAVRERKAQERERHIAELRAETEARLERIWREGQAKLEAARKSREREQVAKRERERQLEEERARTRRAAALKGAETRRRNTELRNAQEAEQRELERQLAEKRRATVRKETQTQRRNAGSQPAVTVSTSGVTDHRHFPARGEPPATPRGMTGPATVIKDFANGSQPAIIPASMVATEQDAVPQPFGMPVTRQEAGDIPPADAEAIEIAPAPRVPAFVVPVTSQAPEKVAATASPPPDWNYEHRHGRRGAADLVAHDTMSSPSTAPQHRSRSLLVWLVVLIVLITGWLQEPALVGRIVALLVLLAGVRIVRNLRLDPLRAD